MAKHIVVVTSHTPSIKWFRIDMINEFINQGNRVTVLGNEKESFWNEYFSKFGIIYNSYQVERNGINPFKDVSTILQLKNAFKRLRPDKLFLYQAKPIIYGALASSLMKVEKYSLVAGLGSVYRGNGVKNKLIKVIMNLQYKFVLKNNEKVFFHNDDDKELFTKGGLVTEKQSVTVHGSGVNMEIFKKEDMPEVMSFLFVGRLIKDKGILEFLESAKIVKKTYPETTFNLVGPYDSNPSALNAEELQCYIDKDIVVYHGSSDKVYDHIKMNSVLVLPSYYEGLPKTVIEAMSVGRPIITTDSPGCRDTVVNNWNGIVVPCCNTRELAKAMLTLLDSSKKIINNMAENSHIMCKENFDVKIINDIILKEMNLKETGR